jgi:hypothetical protein
LSAIIGVNSIPNRVDRDEYPAECYREVKATDCKPDQHLTGENHPRA